MIREGRFTESSFLPIGIGFSYCTIGVAKLIDNSRVPASLPRFIVVAFLIYSNYNLLLFLYKSFLTKP